VVDTKKKTLEKRVFQGIFWKFGGDGRGKQTKMKKPLFKQM